MNLTKDQWIKFLQHKASKPTTKSDLYPELKDYIRNCVVKHGFFLHGYFPCRKCPLKSRCELYNGDTYNKQLPDGSEIVVDKDCTYERFIDTEYRETFRKEYGLDEKADELLLNTIILIVIKIYRLNRWLTVNNSVDIRVFPTQYGDATSREMSPEEKMLDNEIKKLQKVLNELAISRKAREGTKLIIQKDVSIMLSDLSRQIENEFDNSVEVKYTDEDGKVKSKWMKKKKIQE